MEIGISANVVFYGIIFLVSSLVIYLGVKIALKEIAKVHYSTILPYSIAFPLGIAFSVITIYVIIGTILMLTGYAREYGIIVWPYDFVPN